MGIAQQPVVFPGLIPDQDFSGTPEFLPPDDLAELINGITERYFDEFVNDYMNESGLTEPMTEPDESIESDEPDEPMSESD